LASVCSSRLASNYFTKAGKRDVISTKEPVVYVTKVSHQQMNADLPDYNPPVVKPKRPVRLTEAMTSKESLKAARLKNMQSIPGITMPVLDLDLMRKHRSSLSNVYTKEEMQTTTR
jgi:hypothetical protein